MLAAKANELLNLRSKNIQHIIQQRQQAGGEFSATSAIKLPPKNPRVTELHQELGIDKVVIVKCPFEIDTTPGGFYKNRAAPPPRNEPKPEREQAMAQEWSANGNAASAYQQGRLLRGGWAVN